MSYEPPEDWGKELGRRLFPWLAESARPRYYDPEGNPIDLRVWAWKFEKRTDLDDPLPGWRVGEQALDDGTRISTVWLGLDHSFLGPTPLIFETMIFGGPANDYQRRYSNAAAAREGHLEAVRHALWARTWRGRLHYRRDRVEWWFELRVRWKIRRARKRVRGWREKYLWTWAPAR